MVGDKDFDQLLHVPVHHVLGVVVDELAHVNQLVEHVLVVLPTALFLPALLLRPQVLDLLLVPLLLLFAAGQALGEAVDLVEEAEDLLHLLLVGHVAPLAV